MNADTIKYKIEDRSDFTKYIFDFILNIIGLKGKENHGNNGNNVDIYYGSKQPSPNCGVVIRENKSDIVWKELTKGCITSSDIEGIIPFDIVNAIGFFLNDEGNKNIAKEAHDIHDRLIFNKSFQYNRNMANFPIINLYIMFLKSLFERRNSSLSSLPLWPCGKKCVIGLSHDVDRPDKYARLKTPFFNKNVNFKYNLFNILGKAKAIMRLLNRKPNDFWLFEEIMDIEEKFGFKSTFFFASMNQFGEWGSLYDVRYDINSPKFMKVLKETATRGWEIGLHASYNAYLDSNRFSIEKERLTEILGSEVKGLRHHYWHMGRDIEKTLEMHERAGFEYDSSVAFNEQLGFRRNLAFPYYPWNETSARPIQVIQLPVFCMDGGLFYPPIEVNDAAKKIKTYIRTIKQYGGIGIIDWHVKTSYPKNTEYWNRGKTYIKILEYLSTDSEIWVTNLSDITSWLKKREQILS